VATPLWVVIGETFPQGGTLQLTDQVTPFDAGSLNTVAVTCSPAFGARVVWPGVVTETRIGSEIETFTAPEVAGLLTAVAVIVTVYPGESLGPAAV